MQLSKEDLAAITSGMNLQGAQVNIGAENVTYSGNIINHAPSPEAKDAAIGDLPSGLDTQEAKDLIAVFVEHGWMDEQMQSPLSNTQRAVVAMAISQRLAIRNVWSVFGKLWNIKPDHLRAYYNRALDQKRTLSFQDEIKAALQ